MTGQCFFPLSAVSTVATNQSVSLISKLVPFTLGAEHSFIMDSLSAAASLSSSFLCIQTPLRQYLFHSPFAAVLVTSACKVVSHVSRLKSEVTSDSVAKSSKVVSHKLTSSILQL